MNAWYTVYTQSSKESIAEANLINQGFDCFLPKYLKTRRHARKVDSVLKPLFPRYLFVNLDLEQQRWRSINGTLGVNCLLCNGETPLVVPKGVVDAIQTRVSGDGTVNLEAPRFKPGQTLRVLEGPFADLEGLFECVDDNQRITLLLSLLGRQVKVRIRGDVVSAA